MRAGLQEICWQQGAGGARRHWEAVAQLRGDAKCRHRAAANPKHNPWLHICMTMVLPPPPPPLLALAKHPGWDTDSAPFLSFSFYSLSTQLCTLGSPEHSSLSLLLGAVAPQTHSPAPRLKTTYLRALFPREGPHGGLTSSIHLGGGSRVETGCSSAAAAASPPLLICSEETTDFISHGHFNKRKHAKASFKKAQARQPCFPPPHPAPVAPQRWRHHGTDRMRTKKGVTSSPCYYL